MFASTMAYIVVGQPLLDLIFALPICGRAIGPPYLLAKGDDMSLTVIQMAEAIEGAEFIFQHVQAHDVPTVQLEVARYGANIVNFGAAFVLKDQVVPPPTPPTPPNPPVPPPILSKCPCTPDQKKSLESCAKVMKSHTIKPGQSGSMLSVLLAALWPQILAALEAILKNVITPSTPAS